MNGRVYDPNIGRFLSADPLVQAPTNTQSFNRYAYVWNNPLSHTDPSGFECEKGGQNTGNCEPQDDVTTACAQTPNCSVIQISSPSSGTKGKEAEGTANDNKENSADDATQQDDLTGEGGGGSSPGTPTNPTRQASNYESEKFGGPIKPGTEINFADNSAPEKARHMYTWDGYRVSARTAYSPRYDWRNLIPAGLFVTPILLAETGLVGAVLKTVGGVACLSGDCPVGVGGANKALIQAANKPIAKNGLSAAARKLSSHAQRRGGTFAKPSGNIQQQNSFAEKVLRNILENPGSKRTDLSRGGFEIRQPNGQGVRYNADGSFSGFLDPRI